MNVVERIFSQGDACRLSGIPNDVMRDWRRREFLSGIGEQHENGRWSYSFSEILELAIVRTLAGNGQSIKVLLYMASRLSLCVVMRFSKDTYTDWSDKELVAFKFGEDGSLSNTIEFIDNMSRLRAVFTESPQALVVNIPKLIDAIPESIMMLIGNDD